METGMTVQGPGLLLEIFHDTQKNKFPHRAHLLLARDYSLSGAAAKLRVGQQSTVVA